MALRVIRGLRFSQASKVRVTSTRVSCRPTPFSALNASTCSSEPTSLYGHTLALWSCYTHAQPVARGERELNRVREKEDSQWFATIGTGRRLSKGDRAVNLRTGAFTTIGALTLSAGLAVFPASGAVTSVTSSDSVLDVDLTVPSLSFAELPASGSAPPAYDVTNSLPSFSTSLGPISLTTGALTDTASGDTGTAMGSATSTINNLSVSLDSIFNLSSTLISSTSSVNGMPLATGSTTLTGLTITVLGTSVTIPVNPTPNDVIFKVAGLTITLNQQIPDLSESAGITTNAIALDFNKFPFGTNAVNGSIDVAQSFASINVPEPSTWAMMLMGFVGLGYAGYRRARPAQRC